MGIATPPDPIPIRRLKKSSVDPLVTDAEEPGVLEKERALFWQEQVEPVEVDLLVVDFDLREVGVVRRIKGEARRDAVLHVDTGVAQERRPIVGEIRVDGVAQEVRHDLEVALRRHLKPGELTGQR